MTGAAALRGAAAALACAAALLPLASCSAEKETHVPGKWDGDISRVRPPEPDRASLGRPMFRLFNETFPRGTAFILDWEGRAYLVSCYHVFGGNYKAATLVRGESVIGRAASERLPPGSSGVFTDECDARGEVTAMPMTEAAAGARHFRLAGAPARLGQPVWLYSMIWEDEVSRRVSGNSLFAAASFEPYLTPGTVSRSSDFALETDYPAQPALEMSSGAPVLDQNGDVVGINAGFCRRGGKVTGLAAPHQSILKALASLQ